MFLTRITVVTSALGAVVLFALGCETPSSSDPVPAAIRLHIVSGDGQVGPPHQELAGPLMVQVVDDKDKDKAKPVAGQLVNFVVVSGGGSVFAGAGLTNADGIVQEYWTLGDAGPQRLEVRAVDATTGEKLVFATFAATALVPGPEVCDGFDNDYDGSVDEGTIYCFDGIPAPHTNGLVCDAPFMDLDGDRRNGCESLLNVAGMWILEPPLERTCDVAVTPAVLSGVGAGVRVARVTTGVLVGGALPFVVNVSASVSILGMPFSVGEPLPVELVVPFDAASRSFSGSASAMGVVDNLSTPVGPMSGTLTGTAALSGSFVGSDAFSATLTVGGTGVFSVTVNVGGIPINVRLDVTCDPVTLTTTGRRSSP